MIPALFLTLHEARESLRRHVCDYRTTIISHTRLAPNSWEFRVEITYPRQASTYQTWRVTRHRPADLIRVLQG